MEDLLAKGHKILRFQLSYIKVMWKDISLVLNSLFNCKFLPNDVHLHKFLIEFKTLPFNFQNEKIEEKINSMKR